MPGLAQLLERRFEEGLVLDSLAGTQSCEPVQPYINTNDCLRVLWKCIRQLDLDRDKPPVGCFRHAGPCHLATQAYMLCHIHPSQLGNPDTMIPEFKLFIGDIKALFAALFALEPGAFGCAFKKGGERFAQVQKRLL